MAGLYVHVPFCHAKCWYCDFYSVASDKTKGHYVEALAREWLLRRGEIEESTLSTIYFGGGTPSILTEPELCSISEWLPKSDRILETTIEVNPEDVSMKKSFLWQKYLGVNRVSMGIQSLIDGELKSVGRRHSAEDAIRAVDVLRRSGIENVSLDLIYGLPGQTPETWKKSLTRVLEMEPQHLSAYMLSYEPGTRLTTRLSLGKIKETDEDTLLAMYDILCETTRSYGYEHYEISNFARPGLAARHNSAYWTGEPYLGLGPGAHSFDGTNRLFNPRNLKEWMRELNEGKVAAIIEDESEVDRVNDLIMVSLRTSKGLNLMDVPVRFRHEIIKSASCCTRDRVIYDEREARLYIPENGWPVSDGTIASLFVED